MPRQNWTTEGNELEPLLVSGTWSNEFLLRTDKRLSGDKQAFFLAIPSFSLLVLLFVYVLLNRSALRSLERPECSSSPSLLGARITKNCAQEKLHQGFSTTFPMIAMRISLARWCYRDKISRVQGFLQARIWCCSQRREDLDSMGGISLPNNWHPSSMALNLPKGCWIWNEFNISWFCTSSTY